MQEMAALTRENVRLVIWDLDETFWQGTLTEGGITPIERNIDIVRTLASRGIVSSVCSKNDPDRVRAELERLGIWDYVVFPRIAWQPKGAMIRSIVESSQLRPETILFIDDNPSNLNEAVHQNPGLQIAGPECLEGLLTDARFVGKDDRQLSRLGQYRVLEKKQVDREQLGDGSREFLRQSDVRISFHHDVLEQFDRLHELINRTNQLNFTKRRLPEDRAAAREALERELEQNISTKAAYVKVSDKYGEYGIVGFYMTKSDHKEGRRIEHLLFSCRCLNMGVEQFVFRKIGIAKITVVGEVVGKLTTKEEIDWITVVEDAGRREAGPQAANGLICFRGACELDQVTHYLGHRYSLAREFPFPYKGWGVAMPAAQLATAYKALQQPEHKILLDRLPGLHPKILQSLIFHGGADVYVLSFSIEPQWTHFRYKPTGLVVPLKLEHNAHMSNVRLTALDYAQVRSSTRIEWTQDEWHWFRENFEECGQFDESRFAQNVDDTLDWLCGKNLILVMLNARHGGPAETLRLNAAMNAIVKRAAESKMMNTGRIRMIELEALIEARHEVIDANHFRREVYPRLAAAISRAVQDLLSGGNTPSSPG
jgi:FkbH-like protein